MHAVRRIGLQSERFGKSLNRVAPDSFFFDADEVMPRRLRGRSGHRQEVVPMKDCGDCPLRNGCHSPMMKPYGGGELGIVIVGEQPGKDEDAEGRPFVGRSGHRLKKVFRSLGVNVDTDCVVTNAVQCYSAKKPSDAVRHCCWPRLHAQLSDIKPLLVICLGTEAVSSVFKRSLKIGKVRGMAYASKAYQCPVFPTYHPSYILRQQDDFVRLDAERIFERDLKSALVSIDAPLTFLDDNKGNHWITDVDAAIDFIRSLAHSKLPVTFDYETNQLSPYIGSPRVVLVGFAVDATEGYSISVPNPMIDDFRDAMAEFLNSAVPKKAFNAMFEINWSEAIFGVAPRNVVADPMITSHVLDERQGTHSLEWQTFFHFGSSYKQEFGKPVEIRPDLSSSRYNALDCRYTDALSHVQGRQLDEHTARGNRLLVSACPVLADMTKNGIKLDVERLLALRETARQSIQDAEKKLLDLPMVKQTESKRGRMFTFAEEDVRTLFFDSDLFGLKPVQTTSKTNKASIGIDALREAAEDNKEVAVYINLLSDRSEWAKILSTYIEPFLALRDERDLLHPSFMLHTARTYRSSSENPNFQNIPHRGQFADRVRECVLPKLDLLIEVDYSGMEVRVIASTSGDRNLIDELWSGRDLHRYWASRIFDLAEDEIDGTQRFNAKNSFVFPMFYGAFWRRLCGPALFLKPDKAQGLDKMFWQRYPDVKAWQESKIEEYKKHGYITLVSGFRRRAPLDRLKIGNTPVQGPAFHVLLENLVVIHAEMQKRGMRSHMVAETHDSITFDATIDEAEEIVALASSCLTKKPDWLPQDVQFEVEWSMGSDWGHMEKL
jgi:uracil-DNA glycosylase family 4